MKQQTRIQKILSSLKRRKSEGSVSFRKKTKRSRGAALLMALFTIVLMTFIAVEVSYESNIEYLVSVQEIQSLKAHYAARAGLELSLLRIQLFRSAIQQFKSVLGEQVKLLDLIWSFPLVWPPVLPDEMNSVDKDQVQSKVKDSIMETTYTTNIQSEGVLIDINDLASPSEPLREGTKKQILQFIQNRIDGDDDWAKKHRDLRADQIVNNMIDWIDRDQTSLNGGDERNYYRDRSGGKNPLPPNQPFKTLDELLMVSGVTDDIYRAIAPSLTVYGNKGININYASEEVLRSIDPQLTKENAEKIVERRNDQTDSNKGPFKNMEDFNNFLRTEVGIDPTKFNPSKIPLYIDPEFNFRVVARGVAGKVTREIVAIVYDFDTVKERLKPMLANPTPGAGQQGQDQSKGTSGQQTGQPTPTPTPTPSSNSAPKGRPNIVYWFEG